MKKWAVLLPLLLISGGTLANEVSPAQSLQKQFVNSCVGRAIARQDDAVQATNFCTCAFDVLAKELTVAEYIEFDRASIEKRAPDSLPAIARIKGKLSQCKAN